MLVECLALVRGSPYFSLFIAVVVFQISLPLNRQAILSVLNFSVNNRIVLSISLMYVVKFMVCT